MSKLQVASARQDGKSAEFLAGGGEMGAFMRSIDWSQTLLGPPEAWPQTLKTQVSICLNSRFAILIWWGPGLVMVYNDKYREILGDKHPAAMGQPGAECWPEIWDTIGPMLQGVIERGEATWADDLYLPLRRRGYREECFFTFSYSPIRDESGAVAGIFTPVQETTGRVIGERRLRTLEELAARGNKAKSIQEACRLAADTLSLNSRDVPFAAIYLISEECAEARLAAAAGVHDGHGLCPPALPLAGDLGRLAQAALAGTTVILSAGEFDLLPNGAWSSPPEKLIVQPISVPGQSGPGGFLFAGVSPEKHLDKEYRTFFELIAGQIGSAVAEASAYEAERKRAEALAELDRAKTAFFSNVSHEFRTPLTLLLGPLEEALTQVAGLPAGMIEALRTAHRNALRLQKLVNSLLEFSKIEAGRVRANYLPTDLSVLTAELASSFRSAMERAGLAFDVFCPPFSRSVPVDRDMWEKIVLNLLSNALKFTFKGSVTVRLTEREGFAELSVADTGIGISEPELPHVFERFHRVEGAGGRTQEGTGIGLALVQELAKLHGRKVSATSAFGKGSTFTVSIPIKEAHLPNYEKPPLSACHSAALQPQTYVEEALRWLPDKDFRGPVREPVADGAARATLPLEAVSKFPKPTRGRVLVVDDNADMRDYLSRLLSEDYSVTAVTNGAEALQSATQATPDLVLSDVMLPLLDGFGLLKELRAHAKTNTVPVILLSARAGEEAKSEGMEAGADDYLVKPFNARELLARVGANLAMSRLRQGAAAALRKNEERLQQIFAQAPVAICVLRGREFIFELANPPYEAFVPGRRLVGRPLLEAIPEIGPVLHAVLKNVYETGEPFVASEYRIPLARAPGGMPEDCWFDFVYSPLLDAGATVSGIVVVAVDVTSQVRARRELERANRELEEFAYVSSHDLQEPLRMVNIYTQLLERDMKQYLTPAAEEYAKYVHGGVKRMEQMLKDLLDFSRMTQADSDEARQFGSADLNASLSQALETLKGRLLEEEAALSADQLPTVRGDEGQFSQLFQNLISNALKYRKTTERPVVHIAAQQEGPEWIISVQDNGIGFEQNQSERIFGLFKRLHRDRPGTGLGLAICKRVVERYGGRIWAKSQPGEGSTFYIALASAPNV